MNPLTNVRNITKLSERELKQNDGKTSWHDEYRKSAWIFIGGLPFDLSEGDIVAVFSQYGEPVNLNLVRDKGTGKSRGFAFLCYEDQKSTVLAVDNFNGVKILGRTIRVDHVKDYKPPKDSDKLDDITRQLHLTGCAPGVDVPIFQEPAPIREPEENVHEYQLPPRPGRSRLPAIKAEPADRDNNNKDGQISSTSGSSKRKRDKKSSSTKRSDSQDVHKSKKSKKDKKKKSKKKKSKKHKKKESSSSDSSSSSSSDSSSEDETKNRKRR